MRGTRGEEEQPEHCGRLGWRRKGRRGECVDTDDGVGGWV